VKRYLVLGDEKLAINELQPRTDGSGAKFDPAPTRNVPSATGESNGNGGLKSLARSAKDEAEAEAIAKALDETNWNRKKAAELLQISYKALLYKIRQYGIAQQNKAHHKLSAGA
jgi:DNA-binding NtrC family response regulator